MLTFNKMIVSYGQLTLRNEHKATLIIFNKNQRVNKIRNSQKLRTSLDPVSPVLPTQSRAKPCFIGTELCVPTTTLCEEPYVGVGL